MINQLKETILNSDKWFSIGITAIKIILIIMLLFLIRKIGYRVIERVLRPKRGHPLAISERRENTIVILLQNILTYTLFFIGAMMVLAELDVDIKGLIAGAGIVGLAIGFGAQNLVKDIISGFFIIFEDQFAVGDEVKIGDFEGAVQEIGLRTTKILHWTGELYIVPNGSILNVTNYSVYNSIAIIDFSVSYTGKLTTLEEAIQELITELPSKYKEIVAKPELLGIEQFNGDDVVFRVTAETIPMEKRHIERQIRRELKVELDRLIPEINQLQSGEGE